MVARVLKEPRTKKKLRKRNIKSLFAKVPFTDFKNMPSSSILSKADGLGGVFGLFLNMSRVTTLITNPMPACATKLIMTFCLKTSSLSSSPINKTGNTNPTAAPKMTALTQMVRAVSLSVGPNQVAASLAGAFTRNGYAMPQRI